MVIASRRTRGPQSPPPRSRLRRQALIGRIRKHRFRCVRINRAECDQLLRALDRQRPQHHDVHHAESPCGADAQCQRIPRPPKTPASAGFAPHSASRQSRSRPASQPASRTWSLTASRLPMSAQLCGRRPGATGPSHIVLSSGFSTRAARREFLFDLVLLEQCGETGDETREPGHHNSPGEASRIRAMARVCTCQSLVSRLSVVRPEAVSA